MCQIKTQDKTHTYKLPSVHSVSLRTNSDFQTHKKNSFVSLERTLCVWTFPVSTWQCPRPRRQLHIEMFFSQFDVEEFDWPAQTSDINPVQHLWDELEAWVWTRPYHLMGSVLDLTDALVNEWEQIPAAWRGGCYSSRLMPMFNNQISHAVGHAG